jgi:hypothetical protein
MFEDCWGKVTGRKEQDILIQTAVILLTPAYDRHRSEIAMILDYEGGY